MTQPSRSSPSWSGPPRCEQRSEIAYTAPSCRATSTATPSISARRDSPSGSSSSRSASVQSSGRLLERRLVDADALRVAQVPAEVAGGAEQAGARQREQLALPPGAALAGGERGAEQRGRADVERGMDQPDAADGLVADLGVGPLRHAGRGGGRGEQQPQPDQPVGGRLAALPAHPVEQHRAGVRADRQIGEQRVQRVAEPDAAERVLHRPGADGVADDLADHLRGFVERLESRELVVGVMDGG